MPEERVLEEKKLNLQRKEVEVMKKKAKSGEAAETLGDGAAGGPGDGPHARQDRAEEGAGEDGEGEHLETEQDARSGEHHELHGGKTGCQAAHHGECVLGCAEVDNRYGRDNIVDTWQRLGIKKKVASSALSQHMSKPSIWKDTYYSINPSLLQQHNA